MHMLSLYYPLQTVMQTVPITYRKMQLLHFRDNQIKSSRPKVNKKYARDDIIINIGHAATDSLLHCLLLQLESVKQQHISCYTSRCTTFKICKQHYTISSCFRMISFCLFFRNGCVKSNIIQRTT